jgi:hypothetical protein
VYKSNILTYPTFPYKFICVYVCIYTLIVDPTMVKLFTRRGRALLRCGHFEHADESFTRVLEATSCTDEIMKQDAKNSLKSSIGYTYICAYICIYVNMNLHIYTHICICQYIYIYIYIYMYIYIYVYIYICIYLYVYIYTFKKLLIFLCAALILLFRSFL